MNFRHLRLGRYSTKHRGGHLKVPPREPHLAPHKHEQQHPPPPPYVPQAPPSLNSSRIPTSQAERILHYGSLATSLGFGAIGESWRRLTGTKTQGSLLLSNANLERIVKKLSKMRGAALKIGQLISFQDEKVVPKEIQHILSRLQSRANYMPPYQLDKVVQGDLGPEWKDLFASFDKEPFAAASIGQVHKAQLHTGEKVAVKVQYPGVAGCIDSDLKTLALLLLGSRMLPEGLFLDKTIENARTELAWECDYFREAESMKKFKSLLENDTVFEVPKVYDDHSGKHVLTMEFMDGVEISKQHWDQETSSYIAENIMRLCLLEIGKFQFMQTDPNWANFLYNHETKKISLLDFGAARRYSSEFIQNYMGVLKAAVRRDRKACEEYSLKLGYITGFESKQMKDAHIDSILVLGEPFACHGPYDFENQTITQRVRKNIGLMLKERLTPPPEETYGLHRKLSGAFLLCARLKGKVNCSKLFGDIIGVD